MKQYLDFIKYIKENGEVKKDRTKTGTKSIFGYQMRFNLQDGFPILTTKKIFFKAVVYELLWFLSGNTNIKYLQDNGIKIWNEWADENGNLGAVYGKQWRRWQSPNGDEIDQITEAINLIKNKPHSRRIIVSAWNPADLPDENIAPHLNVKNNKGALPPCHAFFQFYVVNNKLSCMLTQRSADAFLGVPFNIASYALLTYMIAQQCDLELGEFIWSGGDCHIYSNHFEQIDIQLKRNPHKLPKIKIKKAQDIFSYKYEDFELIDYKFHPLIKAKISI